MEDNQNDILSVEVLRLGVSLLLELFDVLEESVDRALEGVQVVNDVADETLDLGRSSRVDARLHVLDSLKLGSGYRISINS